MLKYFKFMKIQRNINLTKDIIYSRVIIKKVLITRLDNYTNLISVKIQDLLGD